MKQPLLFLSILQLLGAFRADAQETAVETFINTDFLQKNLTRVPAGRGAAKTTATASRLKSLATDGYDGTTFLPRDSAYINSYTADNGGGIYFREYLAGIVETDIKYDAEISYNYSNSTASWENLNRTTRTFDANNRIATSMDEVWDNSSSSWKNDAKYLYQYDANGNITEEIRQSWSTSGSQWINFRKQTYSYDANNNRILHTGYTWQPANGWINSTLETTTYDANNNMLSSLKQGWNTSTSAWINLSKRDYSYTGTQLNQNLLQNWQSSSWVNVSKETYLYDGAGDNIEAIYQTWTTSPGVFDNFSKLLFTYDVNHNAIAVIRQVWDNVSNTYNNNEKDIYTYNTYNQITSVTDEYWKTGNIWEPTTGSMMQRFHYEAYTTNDVKEINKGGNLDLYPSPAHDVVTINLQWDEKQMFSVAIIDAMGKLWMNWTQAAVASYHEKLNIGNLANGNYWIVIKGEKGAITRQISVMH
ncbi:MAG TPA: T9SS type A sorting domain-containing protein [Flavipsychrobacter sp.]|nr:T9SS type A sorting domain-containing protein [Flavipsychrobacter sp.]